MSADQSAIADEDAFKELNSISLHVILDQDSRPTLVLDLDSDYIDYGHHKDDLRPIFCNTALRLHETLLDSVTGAAGSDVPTDPSSATYDEFRSWATSSSKFDDSRDVFPLTCLYQGILWTGSTVKQRFRIISGNAIYDVSRLPKGALLDGPPPELPVPAEVAIKEATKDGSRPAIGTIIPPHANSAGGTTTVHSGDATSSVTLIASGKAQTSKVSTNGKSSNDTTGSSGSIALAAPEHDVNDWTSPKPKGVLSEHLLLARNVDWAATPLGPMTSWSREFREIVNLVMRNPHPASLFWGEELTMVYNEAYAKEVAGNKHPDLMGTGFSGPFSELWDVVSPVFRECARTGKSVRRENDPLPIERYGYLEETFFSWSFTPLYGGTDRIQGFYNGPFETTYSMINSRRLQTLRNLGEGLAEARSIKHFWKCVLDGIGDNPYDIPFALLYSIMDSDDADAASHSSDSTISLKSCHLEGSIGIPEGHPASPPKLDLKRSKEGFIPAFREAMRTREPTILQTRDSTLPEALLEGIEWRGHGDPCTQAIIIPVRPTNGENVFAFLLIGVNPRRIYDEDYKGFSVMLNRQLATSLASFLLFEDEIKQSRNAAEAAVLQHERISQELELQTSRMRRMTELSPLGMFLFSPDGVLLEANDRYYEMTGHSRNDQEQYSFLNFVADGSKQVAKDFWERLVKDLKPGTEEIQIINPNVRPRDLHGEEIEFWVISSSMPEIGPNGQLLSIMGSLCDISHMKWAEGLKERALREAEETKRQQNEFIDITSHEMRNPLSAILICADSIRETLSRREFSARDATMVEECIESANNIALCINHMKSIVDDILTVSKLDSNLLLITPVPCQPVAVIKRAIKMFEPEFKAKEIQFEFVPHRSLQELSVDWVKLDPSRLLQITVNLLTNAIKFTQTCPMRVISVHVSVTTEQPDLGNGLEFVPKRGPVANITSGADWGDGELLYVGIRVQDTGCGLTVEEKKLLFKRFAQASPRTHAYYGGSGLGLFISRQLAELHGGQIGVSSEAGAGSTFGFFIQARRAAPVADVAPTRYSSPTSVQLRKASEAKHSLAPPNVTSSIPSHLSNLQQDVNAVPTQRPLHILIVEDNLVNQKVLTRQLEKHDCTVYTADNGLHALSFLSTTVFQDPASGKPLSIILMDLEMPEMDGLTCVARIRKMESEGVIKGRVPIIAVTANVRGEQIAMARNSGMDDVVSKPFRVTELLAKIAEVLGRLEGDVDV